RITAVPIIDSLVSDFSSISHRKPDYVRRCILVLLIHAVLIFAVFLAFFVGHWLSGQNEDKNTVTDELQTQRNFTLMDVVPPAYESYEFMEKMHFDQGKRKQDVILVSMPTHTLPLHYDIHLDLTNVAEKLVRGSLTAHLEVFGNSTDDEILFHIGPRVAIDRIRLRRGGKRVYPKTLRIEDMRKLARVVLKERLMKGRYLLEVDYNTTICGEDGGVHCYYELDSVVTSFTTKFEPTLASSFVPCWDDPGIKATFNVSVLHPSRFVVLSNMPRSSEKRKSDGTTMTTFQETPPMSTYLLALAMGEMVPLEARTERNLPLTVWTHPEDFLYARFAANFSPVMFDRLEDELKLPYPLPKMDLIAARSFPVGGMENWGLIVFDKQSDFLLTDGLNTTVDRLYHEYRIEKIITHEIAHQWFGNLVTMRDWSDLWLNEGFATYMVYYLLQQEHPRLVENEYITRLYQLIRKQSTLDHPALVRPLTTELEVEQSFHGTHLYTKGSVMVNMIRNLVSDAEFHTGVRRYLRKNAYRSVSRHELWESMPTHANYGAEQERLSVVMEGWLVNEGIPEVSIIRNYHNDKILVTQQKCDENFHKSTSRRRRNDHHHKASLFNDSLFDYSPQLVETKQRRKQSRRKTKKLRTTSSPAFLSISIHSRREELRKARRTPRSTDIWSVPFSYTFGSLPSSEGQVVRQFWLKNRSSSFLDAELSPSHTLLANPNWIYPYRVNYDITNWKMIARMLHQNHREIPVKSRMQIIVDAETFLSNSDLPQLFIYILGLVYLAVESDLGVALIGMDAIHRLCDAFRGVHLPELQLYLTPAVAQFDKLLDETQADPELAALWLIDPTRLSKIYQLRCITNRHTCDQQVQARRWMMFPSFLHDDVHKQVTAVCHFLFTNNVTGKVCTLSQLKTRNSHWSTAVQLAACSHADRIVQLAAKQIVATKNAAIFASTLQVSYQRPQFRSVGDDLCLQCTYTCILVLDRRLPHAGKKDKVRHHRPGRDETTPFIQRYL
ncbi:unnamed protein product, partial [Angiostrongylus costaricensis]|uniref:Peptidase_M1 domain-containing protein n=1 Tax=Angiostrongylus costaricensis TaxID=334426 RepID=A0A0R3PRG6_ANGCS